MLTKILLIVAGIVFLIAAFEVGIYLRTKGFPSLSQPQSTPQLTPTPNPSSPVVLIENNSYLVSGTITSTFQATEDGNVEGNFILLNDPQKTVHKLIIVAIDGKVVEFY